MKTALTTYWQMFKAGFPFLMIAWMALLITIFTFKSFNPEIINIDPTLPKIALGLLFTLATPIIHYLFKNRKQ